MKFRIKKTVIVFIAILLLSSVLSVGEKINDYEYSESFVITIYSCNYLENVQEFTNHSFLIKVNSTYTTSEPSFIIHNRYNYSDFSIDLDPCGYRYLNITFEVYEIVDEEYFPCDLDKDEGIGFGEIIYDSYTGHWNGDDEINDDSGYGRLNGCDDGSFYEFERDFELCFSIDVIDPDNDNIPRWIEENVYFTDPLSDDSQSDEDKDDIPLFWEHKWGYDPLTWDDHHTLDPDKDGLSNYEEYLTSQWKSDPFRQDIFLELDQMEIGPNGEGAYVPKSSLIQVGQTYAKRNIVFHVDDGCMDGGEILPYKETIWMGDGRKYYREHFLNNDPENWRRGVFRYVLFVYNHLPIRGMEFPGEKNIIFFFLPGLNSFVLSTSIYEMTDRSPEESTAFMILHELGHTLGMCMGRPLGCDNQLMRFKFSLQRILFKNYKSVMNYKYAYSILDYSDGSHGIGDYDDWGNLDLTYFQPRGAR